MPVVWGLNVTVEETAVAPAGKSENQMNNPYRFSIVHKKLITAYHTVIDKMSVPSDDPRSSLRLHIAIVAAVALLLYIPTWSFDFTYLDDNNLILERKSFLENPSSLYTLFGQSFSGMPSDSYYRPAVNITFSINALCGGADPFGYHFVNTLLHLANCILLLVLLRRLCIDDKASLLAALFFAVHPANVASVAWIPGRGDLLLGCFTFGASLSLLRDSRHPGPAAKTAHLLFFLLALFTKETALCLPFVFLCLPGAEKERARQPRRRWVWIGRAAALVLYFAVRHAVIDTPPEYFLGRLQTVWQRWPELLSGLGKLLLPLRLQVVASPVDLLWWPGCIVCAVTIAAWLLPGMRRRITVLALALLVLPLLMSLFSARFAVLENRLYLPAAGVSVLTGELLRVMRTRGTNIAHGTYALVIISCIGLSVVSWRYAGNFRNRDRFSQAAIEGSPNSGIARNLRFRAFYQKEIRPHTFQDTKTTK